MHATEHIFDDRAIWQKKSATLIAQNIRDAITRQGFCTLGLSGGSTPAPIYQALAQETVDWSAVTIFLTDERYVPPTDPQSNQLLVRTTLLDALPVQPTTLFPNTSLSPDACADVYDMQLRTLFEKNNADILILGLGPDGHTASLFPPTDNTAPDRFAMRTQTDSFDVHDRISVTPHLLQRADVPIVLLQGEKKISVWHTMINAPHDPVHWPMHTALAGGNAILFACR